MLPPKRVDSMEGDHPVVQAAVLPIGATGSSSSDSESETSASHASPIHFAISVLHPATVVTKAWPCSDSSQHSPRILSPFEGQLIWGPLTLQASYNTGTMGGMSMEGNGYLEVGRGTQSVRIINEKGTSILRGMFISRQRISTPAEVGKGPCRPLLKQ